MLCLKSKIKDGYFWKYSTFYLQDLFLEFKDEKWNVSVNLGFIHESKDNTMYFFDFPLPGKVKPVYPIYISGTSYTKSVNLEIKKILLNA